MDPKIFNPLSTASENPWSLYFDDIKLKESIRNDVQRTY